MIKVRHQHYQGEAHPADRKVSITFPVARLPLSSDAARHKLKLIAGPRWDSVRDEIKISCELFPTDKMNEKWCSDMVDRMIVEAEVRRASRGEKGEDERARELTARAFFARAGHGGHDGRHPARYTTDVGPAEEEGQGRHAQGLPCRVAPTTGRRGAERERRKEPCGGFAECGSGERGGSNSRESRCSGALKLEEGGSRTLEARGPGCFTNNTLPTPCPSCRRGEI